MLEIRRGQAKGESQHAFLFFWGVLFIHFQLSHWDSILRGFGFVYG